MTDTTPPAPSAADLPMLRDALSRVFAPWVRDLDLKVLQAHAGEVEVQDAKGQLAAHATVTCALL